MQIKELPMYSPHPRAKLFKRYSDNATLTKANPIVKINPDNPSTLITKDEWEQLTIELNNYVNYKSFKWVFASEIQNGQQERMSGLVNNLVYATIKTNTLEFINKGDVIWLQCEMWKQGKYFIVTNDVKQDYIYTPKMRPSYKHIELRSLM